MDIRGRRTDCQLPPAPCQRSRLDSNWGPLIRVRRRQDACFRGREAELPFPMFSRSWRWDSGQWMEAGFSLKPSRAA